MKHTLSLIVAIGVLSAGCSHNEDDELPAANGQVSAADPLISGNPSPGGTESGPPDPMTLLPRPAETLIDFSSNAADRPLDDNGKTMDDLAYLNNLVFNLNEGRATYVSDVIPEFRNDAERLAYEAALAKAKEPVKDLEELVRLKVIKAIPAAPAGKRYAINPTNGKVELTSL